MDTVEFYKAIDKEIKESIKKNEKHELISKHSKNIRNQKSAAFLFWFMEKYFPKLKDVDKFIVEGNDDSSCDLIVNDVSPLGDEIYYVIQSKWFDENSCLNSNKISKEIKACLSDFELILSGKKEKSAHNDKFNFMYEELLRHKKKNKRIDFIFLFLCKDSGGADENIAKFESALVKFKKFDIERLKIDYIDREYRNIKVQNPVYDIKKPIGDIELEIEPENNIEIKKPYPSRIFLVKPKEIFELYEKYGDSLFFENIRNPLSKQNYNIKIKNTLKDSPSNFWYYNNGITVITDNINDFHKESDIVTIKGIQVINGAQTVSAIHKAFSELDEYNRELINNEARISFRVIKSAGTPENVKITKYTNSQNPVINRDFFANDSHQKRLQNDFFANTDIWYETRRSEFRVRKKPKSVKIISNETFAQAYLSFFLQEPIIAKNDKNRIFVSTIDNKNGLYDKIFNSKTTYEDILISYIVFDYVERKRKEYSKQYSEISKLDKDILNQEQSNILERSYILHSSTHIVSFMKISLGSTDQIEEKKNKGIILGKNEVNKNVVLDKFYNSILDKIDPFIKLKRNDKSYTDSKYFKSASSYIEIKALI